MILIVRPNLVQLVPVLFSKTALMIYDHYNQVYDQHHHHHHHYHHHRQHFCEIKLWRRAEEEKSRWQTTTEAAAVR